MVKRTPRGDNVTVNGFGERLRLLREAHIERYGLEHHTQEKWAKRLWISGAQYSRWELGDFEPSYEDLLRISLLFRVDPNFLVAGVVSHCFPAWLYRWLKAKRPELMTEAEYWKHQSALFEQVHRRLEHEGNHLSPLEEAPYSDAEAKSERSSKRVLRRAKSLPTV